MKKRGIFAALTAAMIIGAAGTAVFADGEMPEELSESLDAEAYEEEQKLEVVVMPEADGLAAGEPFINANGVTMAPLRLIGDLVGAEYYYDEETRTVYVSKGDEVEIVCSIGSAYADVNGYTQEIEPPIISGNGYTMWPLRFICENLGAEVTYEDGKIYVNAEPGNEYDDILSQKITNEWIGDSKYGWSMKNPKDMFTSDIYSSADYLSFMGESGDLIISIEEKPKQRTLGTLYTREKYAAASGAKLREAELLKGTDGYDRFYLLVEDDDSQCYYLCAMNDKYIYEVYAYASEEDMPGVRAAADSFRIGFAGEDIYDFAQNRFVNYKKLSSGDGKITIQAPEPWSLSEYDSGYEFAAASAANGDYSGIWIEMYSKEDGVTPETVLEDMRAKYISSTNPEDERVSEITSYDNGVCFEIEREEGIQYYSAFEQGDYVYIADIDIYKGDEEYSFEYADDVIDVIMGSLVCEEASAEEAGRIIFMQEPRGVYDTEIGEYVSFRYPVWWSMYNYGNYSFYPISGDSYSLDYGGIELSIRASENKLFKYESIEDIISDLTDEEPGDISIGGMNFKSVTVSEDSHITEMYIAMEEGVLYTISLEYSDEADKSEAVKLAHEIIDSITIIEKEDKE